MEASGRAPGPLKEAFQRGLVVVSQGVFYNLDVKLMG